MDFLILLLIYFAAFLAAVVCYFYGDSPLLSQGPVGILKDIITQALGYVIPERLRNKVYYSVSNVLHTRNQFLQISFGCLVVLAHIVWIVDVLPILYTHHPDVNHTTIPILLSFINLLFFWLSCNKDPGEITPATLKKYQDVYKYDGRMFMPQTYCKTCNILKPARSKHCGICNRCVHRFDHHCIWTNNDVGGLNHRYFVMYLITLIIMFLEGIAIGGYAMWLYVEHNKVMQAKVVVGGKLEPVTILIAIQHLFMTFPRVVFVLLGLIFLIPLAGTFAGYHIFLVFTNQTTNERYKLYEIHRANKNSKTLVSDTKWPYNHGVFHNLCDIFFLKNMKRKNKR